jgi:hypothetical protein
MRHACTPLCKFPVVKCQLFDRARFEACRGRCLSEIDDDPPSFASCLSGRKSLNSYAQISASVGTFLPVMTLPIRDTFIKCL